MQYPTIAQPQYGFAPTMPMMPSMSDMPPAMMASGGLVDAARAVQSKGRGEDTMLVHMTPGEVGGLQALAMSQGGSLSINPETGLPEAGFLKNLLPTLLGVGLTFAGVDPATAGMIVGGGTTVATGDLGQGILAGLGAYGGAGTAAGLQTSGTQAAGLAKGAQALGTTPQAIYTPQGMAEALGADATGALNPKLVDTFASGFQAGTAEAAASPFQTTLSGLKNVMSSGAQGEGARAAFMNQVGGYSGLAKNIGGISAPAVFATPTYAPPPEEESDYEGPYTPTRRTVSYPGEEQRRRTSEFMYFNPSNPVPFAEGGDVSAPSMSAPEAQVFSQIANVQRLSGLPAIDTSGFNVRSAVPSVAERMGLVYNPIDNTYISPIGSSGTPLGAAGGAERSYGFQSLGNVAVPESGRAPGAAGGIQFFQPVGGFKPSALYGQPGLITPASYLGSGFAREMDRSDPDEYRSKFEPVEMLDTSKPINMANYAYDPILGGYVKLPKFSYSSDDMGFYSYNYEKGGSVPELESGGFVLTKKAVDGLGKGDNKKGQEVASRGLGAIPIKGPGTGTSDSIRTTIDGKQPARIANGESYVPRKEVEKRGGAKKFYALMKKAERRA